MARYCWSVPLPRLPKAHLLGYRVTSSDAHPIGATLSFGIGIDPQPETGTDAERATSLLGVAARWLVYVTALGAAGLALFLLLVHPPEPVATRTVRWLIRLALAGIAATLLRFGVAGLELAGLPPAALLSAAPWMAAVATTLAQASAAIILGLVMLLVGLPGRIRVQAAGIVLIGLAFALSGHAATADPRWLTAPRFWCTRFAARFGWPRSSR